MGHKKEYEEKQRHGTVEDGISGGNRRYFLFTLASGV